MPEQTPTVEPDWFVRLEALAERVAANYPRPQKRPTLTLVQGGDEPS
jgi:hypothetical protein